MNKLKIYDTIENIIRDEWDIRQNEKIIIKGEKAYVVDRSFSDINNLEENVDIEAPFYLEGSWEQFIIE